MEFYRYIAHDRSTVSSDDSGIHVSVPEMRLELEVYNMVKETPKGYWIARGPEMFVSMELLVDRAN